MKHFKIKQNLYFYSNFTLLVQLKVKFVKKFIIDTKWNETLISLLKFQNVV